YECGVIGSPMGIGRARSPRAAKIVRPLLYAMQPTPAFVYLVPIVMLFGIGNVPGVVGTIIFAQPPIIRLTILGINQLPADLIEASRSFGPSPRQMLFKVQLPLAMPTIMAGVNQTPILAVSMVVVA
ncbi:ABC transporter permease subunit, partial [Salmonella enterica]|uniref:ABC transporter permease subunit n=1 Tax=Salmonella enterica TaxID=28901 RepID=UPI000A9D768D